MLRKLITIVAVLSAMTFAGPAHAEPCTGDLGNLCEGVFYVRDAACRRAKVC